MTEDEVKENPVCDNPEIKFTERTLDGQKLYYFVNLTGKKQSAKISVGKDMIDILTGEVKPFCGLVDFEEFDSVMLLYRSKSESYSVSVTLELASMPNFEIYT